MVKTSEYAGWIREPSAVHRGWRVRWTIKHILTDDEDGPSVAKAARAMHERLEKYRAVSGGGCWKDDDEIACVSDEFHTLGFVDGDNADVGYFNTVLNALYDWADDERVLIS